MKDSSILGGEAYRIAALYQLQILDTKPEEDFDDIVLLASQICDTPVSTIGFIDKERVWFKAKHGLEIKEIPRQHSFCAHEIVADDILIVPDCRADEQYNKNKLVSGKSGIRFFAGVPLSNDQGLQLGFLCVMDTKPRTLTDTQISGLRMLGKQAEILLKLRLQIIKLKQTEEEARASEGLMNTIFQNSIDAVIVMDSQGIITQWNPKAEDIFGWQQDDVLGRYFHEIIIPERIREEYINWMRPHESVDDSAAHTRTIEITALRKDKSEFDIALGISPVIIKGESYYINFASDITDRVIATKKLDKQKEFYENILNKLPTDIAVFNPAHKYLFVNPGAIKDEELRKFIVGKDDFEYAAYRNRDVKIAEKRRQQFMEVVNGGKEIRWEDTIKDPDGVPITHLRRLFPVHDENGELSMVIGFGIDITDRKIMEEKQTALVQQLSTQNTQLIDFCNIVSHNLRAPLVNMSMLVSFIEETLDIDEQRTLISKLNPVLDNLHTTFNELVESIQIKQDLEIKSEKNSLEDCLQRTIDGLKMDISQSAAVITADFTEAPTIFCPSKYLFSIFHNLVSNALKYKSPERSPVIELMAKKKNDSVILSVKDNGLGIDLEKHKENFFKIGKVFHRHPNAKGFGLFMTKTQVDAMGGKIWVESKPNEGSIFYIEFIKQ